MVHRITFRDVKADKTSRRSDPVSAEPRRFLRELLAERRAKNPSYSGRAFARDLGMSQSLLSLVLNGKRPLTPRQAVQVSGRIGLSRAESERLVGSTFGRAAEAKPIRARERFARLELDRFKLISHWYHLPLLDLATTRGFRRDPAWIARRLGIGEIEARDALDRLISLGLLVEEGGRLRKSQARITFPTARSEVAVRSFHGQMIQKARDELGRTDAAAFRAREISGMTIAVPKRLLPAAQERIRKFQEELAEFLTEEEADEVYQLNLQFFPLTRS